MFTLFKALRDLKVAVWNSNSTDDLIDNAMYVNFSYVLLGMLYILSFFFNKLYILSLFGFGTESFFLLFFFVCCD